MRFVRLSMEWLGYSLNLWQAYCLLGGGLGLVVARFTGQEAFSLIGGVAIVAGFLGLISSATRPQAHSALAAPLAATIPQPPPQPTPTQSSAREVQAAQHALRVHKRTDKVRIETGGYSDVKCGRDVVRLSLKGVRLLSDMGSKFLLDEEKALAEVEFIGLPFAGSCMGRKVKISDSRGYLLHKTGTFDCDHAIVSCRIHRENEIDCIHIYVDHVNLIKKEVDFIVVVASSSSV